MYKIEFSTQELQALLVLMDVAVKAGGLQVAPAAVVLQQKIDAVVRGPEPEGLPEAN